MPKQDEALIDPNKDDVPEEEEEEEPTPDSPPVGADGAKRAAPADTDSPPAPTGWEEEDDGSEKLGKLLRVMGVPANVTARIVGGYREIRHIRNHPANLHQFLMTHFYKQPALGQQVPVIVQEMMPYLGRPDAEGSTYLPPYAGDTDQRRPPPYGGAYRRGWDTPYPPQWEYERPPRSPDREERESPAIKELRAMVTTLTETLHAEREERRLKEAEAERRQEQEAAEARYAAVSDQVGALATRLEELMTAKATEQQEQAQSGLAQEVVALRKSLADNQAKEIRDENAALRAQMGELKDTLGAIYLKVEQAGSAPAGRTAEDLIAELGPVALDKIDRIGTNVNEQLSGWRDKMTPGGVVVQGPGLRPPADKGANPAAAPTSPVDEANEIARRAEAAQAFLRARAATSAATKQPPAAS